MVVHDVNDRSAIPGLDAAARVLAFSEPSLGLEGYLVLDDLTLGPAAGGVRTRAYADGGAALADAARLARAMTLKCSLAGLDAGGGKAVVIDRPDLDRPRAFAALGELIESLDGQFRTAGDLGTTAADLAAMASRCQYVHTEEFALAGAAARGLLRCLEAVAGVAERDVAGLRVAIQGCGAIGAAVAAELAGAGARLWVSDTDPARASAVGAAHGATVLPPGELLTAEVDVLAPCAVGGVIDRALVPALRASIICGAANNVLSGPDVGRALADREVLFVPDEVASAGAVILGIGVSVMQLEDPTPLIDFLGPTTEAVFADAARTGRTPTESAEALARFRIGAVRYARGHR